MSEHLFERQFPVATPLDVVARFFRDGEAWFRLNPEWEVLALDASRLKVRYERSEWEADYRRATDPEFAETGGTLLLAGDPPRTIELRLTPETADVTRIDWRESFPQPPGPAHLAELNLWVSATAGYLALAARHDRKARLGHWLLDRVWLRMSPTARRVGLLIVGMEGLALLLFIAVLIVYRFFG